MSTNRAPFSSVVANGHADSVCRREAAELMRGDVNARASPATTTASTPEAPITSASRNAANGARSSAIFVNSGSSRRRMTRYATAAAAPPAAIPPTYESSTSPVTFSAVYRPPVAMPTATRVDHQGGAVVGEALRFQQHEVPARQGPAERRDRGRVRRRDGGTQDQAGGEGHAEQLCGTGDREGGGHRQQRAEQHDPAQVPLDGAQRGGQALPEQQGRQEQQQHRLRRQLDPPQRRHEPETGRRPTAGRAAPPP